MVDESDRVWINLDSIHKAVSDHCTRLTRLEQIHFTNTKNKDRKIIYVLLGVALLQFAFIMIERLIQP